MQALRSYARALFAPAVARQLAATLAPDAQGLVLALAEAERAEDESGGADEDEDENEDEEGEAHGEREEGGRGAARALSALRVGMLAHARRVFAVLNARERAARATGREPHNLPSSSEGEPDHVTALERLGFLFSGPGGLLPVIAGGPPRARGLPVLRAVSPRLAL
jgi:hypothetical protein